MKRSILAAMVLSLALAGCNTSYNYFEDDTEGAPDPGPFNLAKSLMQHAGVVDKEKQRVAYKPRAPLAMPGSSDLPNPQHGQTHNEAEAAVNFPTDHADAEAQRKEQLATLLASNEDPDGLANGTRVSQQGGRLPPEALAKAPEQRDNSEVFRDKNPVRTMKEMREKLNFRKPNEAVLTDEGKASPRKYLIQPPDEYRTPAETAALPEKGDIENSDWVKKQLYRNVDSKPHTYVQN